MKQIVFQQYKLVTSIIMIIYTLLYLAYVFVEWRFINPLQWFIDIPTAGIDHRAGVLASWAIVIGIKWVIIWERSKMLRDKSK